MTSILDVFLVTAVGVLIAFVLEWCLPRGRRS